MPQAWDINKGSNNITVAVIDSGIDYTHKDFIGRTIIKGPDYVRCAKLTVVNGQYQCVPKTPDDDPMDDYGHGTHVAGTIGAVTNNDFGIAGTAWNVTLMAVKTMNAEGDGDDESISRGIWYAADNGADIINLSIANYIPCSSSEVYRAAIRHAIDKNIVVIAAAGNKPIDAKDVTPASCDGVITVASTDKNDQRAASSGWGSKVEIAAPGVGILSLVPGNKFLPLSGTSMAAPHVAGVAALLLSQRPLLSLSEVENCLVSNADSISTDKPIGPRLNAFKSLNSCSGQPPITSAPLPTSALTATPVQNSQITPTQTGSTIKGTVFIDKNGDKLQNNGELGYPGAQIVLEGKGLSMLTNPNGEYSFGNLPEGTYKVNLIINGKLEGYTASFGIPANFTANIFFPLTIPPSQNTLPTSTPKPTSLPSTKKNSTPTPQKTYSCHMKTSTPKNGAIQIGDLECTPN